MSIDRDGGFEIDWSDFNKKFIEMALKTAPEAAEKGIMLLSTPMTTYEAAGSGTKYTTRVVGDTKGFFKLAEGLVASQLEKSLAEDAERLKELLEKA